MFFKHSQMKFIKVYLALFISVFSQEVFAQTQKNIPAIRLTTKPVIDGQISPDEWKQATVIRSGMHQIRPRNGAKPSLPTDIYIAYDDENLYVAARMYDTSPNKIVARQMIEGRGMDGEDAFKVILSPFNNKQSGYFFKANPNGIREDALFEGDEDKNFNWSAIWHVKSSIDDKGWVTEFRIPFKSINFNPNNSDWGISFGRDIGRFNERLAWTSFDRDITLSSLGELQGVEGVKQGLGLDINMGLSGRNIVDYGADTKSFKVEPSIDAFYKITPSLTAVLTLNTDFSATDIDDQVVNLSRFSVFLPEKRDFFLQDADIFNFGGIGRNGRPFFSRTIGLGEEGEELKLRVGGKLTGRMGKWNLGLLDVVQENYNADGNTNLIVARIQRRVLEQSSVGAILTYGDPLTGKGAYTLGADFLYRDTKLLKGKTAVANFWAQMTHTPGDLDDAKNKAFGTELEVSASTGLKGGIEFARFGENFDPAMGFANRVGIDKMDYWTGYTWRPNSSWIKRLEARVWQGHWWKSDGSLESRAKMFKPLDLRFTTDDSIEFSMNSNTEVLSEPFEIVEGVIIPVGEYTFNKHRLTYDSSGRRMIGLYASYENGDYYTGKRKSIFLGARFQPNKYVKLELRYTTNKIDLPEGAFTTKQYIIKSNIAFSSNLSWVTQVQYNNVSREGGINSRLRYNPEPGQDLYFIVNHGVLRDDVTDRFRSTSNQMGLKLGYTMRF